MITVELKFFVTLAPYMPENAHAYSIEENTRVDALIKNLGIPDDLVKLIFINGRKQDSRYPLKHGDRLGLFPPVGGG